MPAQTMAKQRTTPRSSVHSRVEAGVFVDDVLVANVTPPQTSVPLDLHETGSEHVLSVLSRDGRRLRNTDAAVNRALTGSIVGRDQARLRATTPCTKQGFRACSPSPCAPPGTCAALQVLRFLSQPDARALLAESDPVQFSYTVAFPVVLTVFALYGHPEELDTHVVLRPIGHLGRIGPNPIPNSTDSHFFSARLPEQALTTTYGILFRVELTEEDSLNFVGRNEPRLTDVGRRVLYEHFMPLRMYLASEATLHFESTDEEGSHFSLTAPSSCAWGFGCGQQYERGLTISRPATADLFELFMLLDIWDMARMSRRLFTSMFDVLFESVSGDVAREAAVDATLDHCGSLLRARGPRDFALGIDCLVFVPRMPTDGRGTNTGPGSYLSPECSHRGVFLCGLGDDCDCYCDTWTWGRSCEFNWDANVRFSSDSHTCAGAHTHTHTHAQHAHTHAHMHICRHGNTCTRAQAYTRALYRRQRRTSTPTFKAPHTITTTAPTCEAGSMWQSRVLSVGLSLRTASEFIGADPESHANKHTNASMHACNLSRTPTYATHPHATPRARARARTNATCCHRTQ